MRRLGPCAHGTGSQRTAGRRGISIDRDLSQLFFGKMPRVQLNDDREEPWYKKQCTDTVGVRKQAEALLKTVVIQIEATPSPAAVDAPPTASNGVPRRQA